MLPDLNLSEAIEGVRSLLKDLTNVLGLFDKNVQAWFRVTKRINHRREVQKLGNILHLMTRLNYEQRTIPGTLRAYAGMLDKQLAGNDRRGLKYEEARIQGAISTILEGILQLREFLQENQSSLLERNPKIFDTIIEALDAREEFFEKFYSSFSPDDPSQLSDEHPKLLRELATEYEKLVELLGKYRERVATFLAKVDK